MIYAYPRGFEFCPADIQQISWQPQHICKGCHTTLCFPLLLFRYLAVAHLNKINTFLWLRLLLLVKTKDFTSVKRTIEPCDDLATCPGCTLPSPVGWDRPPPPMTPVAWEDEWINKKGLSWDPECEVDSGHQSCLVVSLYSCVITVSLNQQIGNAEILIQTWLPWCLVEYTQLWNLKVMQL